MTKRYDLDDLEPGFPPPYKTRTKTGRRYTLKYWGPNYVSTEKEMDFYRRTAHDGPVTIYHRPKATDKAGPSPKQPRRSRAKSRRP